MVPMKIAGIRSLTAGEARKLDDTRSNTQMVPAPWKLDTTGPFSSYGPARAGRVRWRPLDRGRGRIRHRRVSPHRTPGLAPSGAPMVVRIQVSKMSRLFGAVVERLDGGTLLVRRACRLEQVRFAAGLALVAQVVREATSTVCQRPHRDTELCRAGREKGSSAIGKFWLAPASLLHLARPLSQKHQKHVSA